MEKTTKTPLTDELMRGAIYQNDRWYVRSDGCQKIEARLNRCKGALEDAQCVIDYCSAQQKIDDVLAEVSQPLYPTDGKRSQAATCEAKSPLLEQANPDLVRLVELHANQCSEWAARMGSMGESEEAGRYRADEADARAVLANIAVGATNGLPGKGAAQKAATPARAAAFRE